MFRRCIQKGQVADNKHMRAADTADNGATDDEPDRKCYEQQLSDQPTSPDLVVVQVIAVTSL